MNFLHWLLTVQRSACATHPVSWHRSSRTGKLALVCYIPCPNFKFVCACWLSCPVEDLKIAWHPIHVAEIGEGNNICRVPSRIGVYVRLLGRSTRHHSRTCDPKRIWSPLWLWKIPVSGFGTDWYSDMMIHQYIKCDLQWRRRLSISIWICISCTTGNYEFWLFSRDSKIVNAGCSVGLWSRLMVSISSLIGTYSESISCTYKVCSCQMINCMSLVSLAKSMTVHASGTSLPGNSSYTLVLFGCRYFLQCISSPPIRVLKFHNFLFTLDPKSSRRSAGDERMAIWAQARAFSTRMIDFAIPDNESIIPVKLLARVFTSGS